MDFFTNMLNLSNKTDLDGFLSKTFPDSSIQQMDKISESSPERWMSSGIVWHGECWMGNSLEHPSDAEELTLSQVLEPAVPLKYFLNPSEIQSLIYRAESRGTSLPEKLMRAYQKQLSFLSSMQESIENPLPDLREKDIETTEQHILSIPEEERMLYVRRMTPLEYERLQGFPDGWTAIDTEL